MNIFWDAEKYKKDFSFVPQYGEAVMDLDIMDREPDEDIIVVASVNDVR